MKFIVVYDAFVNFKEGFELQSTSEMEKSSRIDDFHIWWPRKQNKNLYQRQKIHIPPRIKFDQTFSNFSSL